MRERSGKPTAEDVGKYYRLGMLDARFEHPISALVGRSRNVRAYLLGRVRQERKEARIFRGMI
jgi:hypothetical protein